MNQPRVGLSADGGGSTGLSWRDLLFGDVPMDQWPASDDRSEFPWNEFILARRHLWSGRQNDAMASWRKIVAHPGLESRHYLQAWYFLRQNGARAPKELEKNVLGVVVEVALPSGLDLLASYKDHGLRYLNYSGAAVVWDHRDSTIDPLIADLLVESEKVISEIGPWNGPRPPAPPIGCTRLSFLAPGGLYFGQASSSMMAQDPRGKLVFAASVRLLQALLAKATPKK